MKINKGNFKKSTIFKSNAKQVNKKTVGVGRGAGVKNAAEECDLGGDSPGGKGDDGISKDEKSKFEDAEEENVNNSSTPKNHEVINIPSPVSPP